MPVRHTAGFIVLIIVILSVGCSKFSPEAQKEEHRKRAQAYFEKHQYQEAMIELKNVIQLDPKDTDAHYRLALTYLKMGGTSNFQAAYGELTKTVELDAANQDAQLKLGELYLLGRDPAKARYHAEVVLASSPENTQGLILHGQSLISQKEFDKGIAELKKAIELDPTHVPTYLTLAQAYVSMNNRAAAEEALTVALKVDPQSVEARTAMGDLRFLQGKSEEAEAEYKRAVELAPGNELLSLKLAGFYQATQRWDLAEAAYRKLAEAKPNDEKPQLFLGEFYAFTGHPDKALESYRRAVELNPGSAPARDKLIDHYLDIGKIEEAEKHVQTILEKNGRDMSGRVFDARIRLARGNADGAIDLLQGVVRDDSRLASAHHFLGLAYLQKNDISQARRELTESVTLAPSDGESRTALAALHLSEGSYDLAIEQARAALRLNGRNLRVATILGDAYLGKGDISKAKQAFEVISKALPQEAYSRYRLGVIAEKEKNETAALGLFEEALTINPHLIEPLAEIATMKLARGKDKEARERVLRQLEVSPKNPLIYNLLGNLWMKAKDYDQAEAAFKQALEANPQLPISYMNLGELYLATGKQAQAIQEYEAALVKNPKLNGAHMVLGMIHEQRKDYDKAKLHYEQVLKITPKFGPAANNLAWILNEQGQTDMALSYAEAAREQAPNDPNIADTLGWIYYKKNAFLKARSLLKEAAEKLPDNPLVQYHYGMAQHKSGDAAGAKRSLQASLKLSQNFPGAEEAREVLKEL